jgi:hypothetical protein
MCNNDETELQGHRLIFQLKEKCYKQSLDVLKVSALYAVMATMQPLQKCTYTSWNQCNETVSTWQSG